MTLNGRLPSSMLATIPGTSRLIAVPLLAQVVALRAEFTVRFGKPLVLTETYRDYETQVRYRANYLAGRGAYAVPPGTSNHGWGTAIDFGSGVADIASAEHVWMVANAPRFGFVWLARAGNGSIEPWHFDGAVVPASNYVSAPHPSVPTAPEPDPIPAPAPRKDDDMAFTATGPDGQVWHLSGVFRRPITQDIANALSVLADPVLYQGDINATALAGYADIGGISRTVVEDQP